MPQRLSSDLQSRLRHDLERIRLLAERLRRLHVRSLDTVTTAEQKNAWAELQSLLSFGAPHQVVTLQENWSQELERCCQCDQEVLDHAVDVLRPALNPQALLRTHRLKKQLSLTAEEIGLSDEVHHGGLHGRPVSPLDIQLARTTLACERAARQCPLTNWRLIDADADLCPLSGHGVDSLAISFEIKWDPRMSMQPQVLLRAVAGVPTGASLGCALTLTFVLLDRKDNLRRSASVWDMRGRLRRFAEEVSTGQHSLVHDVGKCLLLECHQLVVRPLSAIVADIRKAEGSSSLLHELYLQRQLLSLLTKTDRETVEQGLSRLVGTWTSVPALLEVIHELGLERSVPEVWQQVLLRRPALPCRADIRLLLRAIERCMAIRVDCHVELRLIAAMIEGHQPLTDNSLRSYAAYLAQLEIFQKDTDIPDVRSLTLACFTNADNCWCEELETFLRQLSKEDRSTFSMEMIWEVITQPRLEKALVSGINQEHFWRVIDDQRRLSETLQVHDCRVEELERWATPLPQREGWVQSYPDSWRPLVLAWLHGRLHDSRTEKRRFVVDVIATMARDASADEVHLKKGGRWLSESVKQTAIEGAIAARFLADGRVWEQQVASSELRWERLRKLLDPEGRQDGSWRDIVESSKLTSLDERLSDEWQLWITRALGEPRRDQRSWLGIWCARGVISAGDDHRPEWQQWLNTFHPSEVRDVDWRQFLDELLVRLENDALSTESLDIFVNWILPHPNITDDRMSLLRLSTTHVSSQSPSWRRQLLSQVLHEVLLSESRSDAQTRRLNIKESRRIRSTENARHRSEFRWRQWAVGIGGMAAMGILLVFTYHSGEAAASRRIDSILERVAVHSTSHGPVTIASRPSNGDSAISEIDDIPTRPDVHDESKNRELRATWRQGGETIELSNSNGERMDTLEVARIPADTLNWNGHPINIPHDVLISQTEVTEKQFALVMGRDIPENSDLPVTQITWFDAEKFCEVLALAFQGKTPEIRLPWETEWQHARQTVYSNPEDEQPLLQQEQLERMAKGIYPVDQEDRSATRVGGLLGNVSEWMRDSYTDNLERRLLDGKFEGPTDGMYRVIRGRSSHDDAGEVIGWHSVDQRNPMEPQAQRGDVGFRIVIVE